MIDMVELERRLADLRGELSERLGEGRAAGDIRAEIADLERQLEQIRRGYAA